MNYRYILLISLLLFSFLGQAQEESIKERLVVPLSNPDKVVWLDVNLVNGNITVVPYDGKEVIIEASANENCCGDDHDHNHGKDVSGMKKINATPFDVEATEEDNEVEISTNSWQRKIDLKISTPKNTHLKVGTVHGKVEIDGVNGNHEISAVNGGISFSNVEGSILSNTVNGDVSGNFTKVNSEKAMSFVTLNGDVDVTFPASIKAKAKMKSERGDIYTDFEMTISRSEPKVEKSSDKYRVAIESWVTGAINGGGPEYIFKNMNGSIYVRKK